MEYSTSVSVVIPCYNSQDSLPQLLEELRATLESTVQAFEIICVNDNSSDDTWATILAAVESYPLQAITLMRNYGQHNAILCGVRAARYDVIVTLDDDLQNPPAEIPVLLKKLAEGYDVVYGRPATYKQSYSRMVTSRMVRSMLRHFCKVQSAGEITSFRAFRTCLRGGFTEFRSPFVSLDVLLTWATTKITAVAVQHRDREYGRSNYSWAHLFTIAMNLMTAYSVLPLRVASFSGLVCLFLGSVLLLGLFAQQMITAHGFGGVPVLAGVVSLLSGAQLLAIGVMGEYLARIYSTSVAQPPYVIKSKVLSRGMRGAVIHGEFSEQHAVPNVVHYAH